jgi:hypothetical protein
MGSVALVIDGVVTCAIFKMGGRELNPLFRYLVSRMGLFEALLLTRVSLFSLLVMAAMYGSTLMLIFAAGPPIVASLLGLGSVFLCRA